MAQTDRKLAAIMLADIAGYSSLMERDESRTFARVRAMREQRINPKVAEFGGRIIKTTGDGFMAEFPSATAALSCGIAIQRQNHAHETNEDEADRFHLRIGLNLGDIIIDGDDVSGDGVNIAARLEPLAPLDGICLSGAVRDQIREDLGVTIDDFGEQQVKNISRPIRAYRINLANPPNIKRDRQLKIWSKRVAFTALSLFLVIFGVITIENWIEKEHARSELLPALQKLVNDNYRVNSKVLNKALEIQKILPDDPILTKLWPIISTDLSIETDPPGAKVFWKDYDTPQAEWRYAGITPISGVKIPRSFLRMEIRKEGYQTIEYAGPDQWHDIGPSIAHLRMDALGSLPENMVRIPGRKKVPLRIVALEQNDSRDVPEFLADKYLVTNMQFKKFIDSEGYEHQEYWHFPILSQGKEISFKDALDKFRDRTGRLGPATWEAGTYPSGQENHPVTGISWYEAAAFAAYAKKKLPTLYHWAAVADTSRTEYIVPLSNFNGKSTTEVGSLPGISTFGIYDIAGNAREWIYNQSDDTEQHYTLGGGWNDPTYMFNDSYTQSALDRSIANGFRCIKEIQEEPIEAILEEPVSRAFRDYAHEMPVSDDIFKIFAKQFSYDKSPLNATLEKITDNANWDEDIVSLDAAYNNEKMQLHLYLPKHTKSPLQPIIFFPGSSVLYLSKYISYEQMGSFSLGFPDFIIKGGRALVVPIFKGTFERQDSLKSDYAAESVLYKDHVIMWRKDLGRAIDYLETREDIQSDKIGYYGWSWGGYMGGIMPAVEKRIKVIVAHVGGMQMTQAPSEVDQINYLPRVTQPFLMLNGEHDMFFPVETSQKPMFNFLGTAKNDKKMIVYPTGHLVPRTELIKETLAWFDTYLGPVR